MAPLVRSQRKKEKKATVSTKYKSEKTFVDSRSNDEVTRDKMYQQEEQERIVRKPSGIGSFLSVTIPLSETTKEALEKFKQNLVNLIELKIENNSIVVCNATTVTEPLNKYIVEIEPRFYVYAHSPSANVFIYCCPDKSPQKLRMVYSTSKPQVATQVEQFGINLAKKRIEVTEGSELTSDYITSEISPAKYSSPGFTPTKQPVTNFSSGAAKGSRVPVMNAPHPIYGLMNQQNQDSKKKKIVIPPSGAW